MNLLILPVGWMNAYNGVTPQDPYLGINEKEAYNFSPYDGFCYGISSLVPQIQEEKLEDVLVVWISQDEYEALLKIQEEKFRKFPELKG